MNRVGSFQDNTGFLSQVDLFGDLSPEEVETISSAAPMKSCAAGELLYSPRVAAEILFILKEGRVRLFRVAPDGSTLTTSILGPGTIFGEMVQLGQHMDDNCAEAMDAVVVSTMTRTDVRQLLLADPRIAARVTEFLGRRLTEAERRLSDVMPTDIPQRIAKTLATIAGHPRRYGIGVVRAPVVALTGEQIATLAGTSRETATKVLEDFSDKGMIRLGHGHITVLEPERIRAEAGE